MKAQIIFKTSRKITLELLDQGIVTTQPYEIRLNGKPYGRSDRVVQTIAGLLPDTSYELQLCRPGEPAEVLRFRTESEFVTLDVRDFGAKGDGVQDDTPFIQAAIQCCPPGGRVYIPEGTYRITSLFLISGLTLDIGRGAVLSADTDRSKYPILPGLIDSWDEQSEYNLGTWEGNPLEMFASILTGINVQDVVITGEGTLDGNASYENWWEGDGREKKGGAFRPRMIFLNHCRNITVHGLKIQNSPAWTLHPYFSDHTRWIDLAIENPKVSPNTDGMDPESVDGLEVVGVRFSLGDDCIAVKSGKMYMGRKCKKPSKNIEIRQCHMCFGHGAVTLGSEIGAGVQHLYCHDCLFEHTDRGLRVKTRRGRGRDSVVADIVFENIKMDGVLTPFVVNSYYWCCDPDGHSEYVRCKQPLPVDDRTPLVRHLEFRHIEAKNCHVAATFLYGLPEEKIDEIIFDDVHIDFDPHPTPDYPAMMADVEPCSRRGMFVNNCKKLVLHNVTVEDTAGDAFELENIDKLVRD